MRSLVVLVLVACHARSPSVATSSSEIRIDRRIELMSIVMRLTGAEEYNQAFDSPYSRDVDATFEPFESHPAIAATKALRASNGISFDAPMHLAIHLDDQLRPRALPDLVASDERWRGVDVNGYAEKLRDFAAVAKLDAFMAKHRDYYRRVEDAFHARLDAENPRGWFEATFGMRAGARFVIVPGLLNGGANYGPHATLDGAIEMYQILGVYHATPAGTPTLDDETVATLIHEMAHSYINPVFDKHQADLARAGKVIFPLVEKKLREQAYADAATMFDEAGVRAITVVYLRDRHGGQAGSDAEIDEIRRSFIWTPALARLFERFRREHATYPTLESFMPEVIGFFDDLATSYAKGLPPVPFLGPVDAVYDGAAFLAPTTKDAKLASYVESIRQKFFASAPRERGGSFVAYGSPQSNVDVQSFLAQSHLGVASDRITIGAKTFSGDHLVLIACWPLPGDPTRGMVVYTAANDADIIGINSVRHGGTDWVVAKKTERGFETLGMGDFPHAVGGAWRLP